MHHPTDRITHTMAFVTPIMEHWLEPEIAQWEVSYHVRIYRKCFGRKEGNILFNDAFNTFYLRYMVKDHSDNERVNLLPQHGLLFLISSKGSFICTIPQTG